MSPSSICWMMTARTTFAMRGPILFPSMGVGLGLWLVGVILADWGAGARERGKRETRNMKRETLRVRGGGKGESLGEVGGFLGVGGVGNDGTGMEKRLVFPKIRDGWGEILEELRSGY